MTRRDGFTLIEVVVAASLLGLVTLLAAATLSAVSRAAVEVGLGRRQFDREMNARRWLVRSLRSLDIGAPDGGAFAGDSNEVTYTTWTPVAGGWVEPTVVRLALDGGRLTAYVDGAPTILVDSVASLAIDYLLTPGALSKWTRTWKSASQPPLALRLRVLPINAGQKADTLLLLIKDRG